MTSSPSRRLSALAVVGTVVLLAGCTGSPTDPLALSGCLEGDSGTIAVGVANTSSEAIVVDTVELTDSSGVEIVDRFIARDEDARETAVLFDPGDRDAFGGVDLAQQPIDADAAAFVGVQVVRTGSEDGRVGGLIITVDGADQSVPVTLDLRDDCG